MHLFMYKVSYIKEVREQRPLAFKAVFKFEGQL